MSREMNPGWLPYSIQEKFNKLKKNLLSQEEERELIRRWQEDGDEKTRETLLIHFIPFVVKQAFKTSSPKAPLEDTFSAGFIGLMRALETFDLTRKLRFSTYAFSWVYEACSSCSFEYERRFGIKVPNGNKMKKTFGILARHRKEGEKSFDSFTEKEKRELAKTIGVGVDILEAIWEIMIQCEVPIWGPVWEPKSHDTNSELNETFIPQGTFECPEQSTLDREEKTMRLKLLAKAMNSLGSRERLIIEERKLSDEPPTLAELGKRFGVSRERIRQIEARALKKIMKSIRKSLLIENSAMFA